jgi:hypothetical protein
MEKNYYWASKRKYAGDRALTLEEMKLIEYPDRR